MPNRAHDKDMTMIRKNLNWIVLAVVLVAILAVAYVLVANAAIANPGVETPPGLLH